MKLKKTILYIITLLLIPIIVTFSICLLPKNQNIKGIIIGNPIENVNLKYSYDNSFTSSFMNSSFLLQMLENDASKESEGKIIKLSRLIKDSSFILINIGKVDLSSLIKINEKENKLIFDKELIYQKSQVITYNLQQCIDLIFQYNNNIDVYIAKIAYNYSINNSDLINCYNDINNAYQNIASVNNVFFIE